MDYLQIIAKQTGILVVLDKKSGPGLGKNTSDFSNNNGHHEMLCEKFTDHLKRMDEFHHRVARHM